MKSSRALLLFTATLAAARDRKPLPQSTVLTLTAGEARIASTDHPASTIFRVHPPAAGDVLCRPVAGIACCSGAGAWYIATNTYREGDFEGAGFQTVNHRPLSDRRLSSWDGKMTDTLIPGPSIGKESGARKHSPCDDFVLGSPESVRCFATWRDGALEPYAQASTEARPRARTFRMAHGARALARP